MEDSGFRKMSLSLDGDMFAELSAGIHFEKTGKGRLGNHLMQMKDSTIPLVRTTSRYDEQGHTFSNAHMDLAERISASIPEDQKSKAFEFNNALIEVYDHRYHKMKYHSDQCLDLARDSFIALYSCYEHPTSLASKYVRKLRVMDKETEEEFEFELGHNSVVLFPMEANRKYLHKIVLDRAIQPKKTEVDNRWLGVTFRQSKTFIQFREGTPYFLGGRELRMATEEEEMEFFKLRGQENRSMDFEYPALYYTISPADLLPPKEYFITESKPLEE